MPTANYVPKDTDVFRDALREVIGLDPIFHKSKNPPVYMNSELYLETTNMTWAFSHTECEL